MKLIQVIFVLLFCNLVILSCRREVDTEVTVDFEFKVVNEQYQVPVQITFTNKTNGANQYKWSFEGGTPDTYDKREPGTIIFNRPGALKVILEAWNNDQRKVKEITILLDTPLAARFDAAPVINNIAPADFSFTNNSAGASRFQWSFENGIPATDTSRNPRVVRFTSPGTHRVFLEVFNHRNKKDTITRLITVRPPLSASFEILPSFDDDDYQAPLSAKLDNHTVSATTHNWSVNGGGSISNTSDSIPTLQINNPGIYTVTYKAHNGKDSATITRTITVLPNTFLRSFSNVKLGINSAGNTIGCFFSTRLRQVFKLNEITAANGDKIDLPFFGLNSSFVFNRFVSPDSVQGWTFPAIPGATHTAFVNSQEWCNCNTPPFTNTDFDNLVNGSVLSAWTVPETAAALREFSDVLTPRLVLFRNAAGKKGVIRIKQFVQDSVNSYILCDIKVQKD